MHKKSGFYLFLPDFDIVSISTEVCSGIMVLIGISLMTGDDEHLFMCFFASYISSLVKCLFLSFAYFLIGLAVKF